MFIRLSETIRQQVGTLELLVPKDREGQFQRELFERCQRSAKALLVVPLCGMQMCLQGVSTRKLRAITEERCGLETSKSQVSALSRQLDEMIQRWRERLLERSYPYLVVDARSEKVRRGGQVVSQGVLLLVGISPEGYREILGGWGGRQRERDELIRGLRGTEPARAERRALCSLR